MKSVRPPLSISGLTIALVLCAATCTFGSEQAAAELSWDAPTYHDYGLLGVGIEEYFLVSITNTGTEEFVVSFSLPDTTQSFIRSAGDFIARPGEIRSFGVGFKPVMPGHHSVLLDLGDVVPPILLEGDGLARPESFSVEPDTIDFGWEFLGDYTYKGLWVYNTGGTFLNLGVYLSDVDLGFSLTRGEESYFLPPGDDHLIHVLFQPTFAGEFTTQLNLGPFLDPVPVFGNAESKDGLCITSPDTLFFGPVPAGGSQTLQYSVTNNTHQDLGVSPNTQGSEVFVAPGAWTNLSPGETQAFDLVFQPRFPLNYSGNLTVNYSFCSDIALVGTATPPAATDQNLVGLFFDQDYATIDTKTYQYNQIVTGYLVMFNPSETTGVGAWELALDIEGDATWLGWNIEGLNINIGQYNELIVGIGGTPLPDASEILLATGYLQVTQPYPHVVDLGLKPIWNASIPGRMAWAPWHDPALLIPLNTLTGREVVAGINWNSAADAETPSVAGATGLLPNIPNPFNPSTEIRFTLDKPRQVRVSIYDVTGKLVKILADGPMDAGPQTRTWQGRDSAGRQVPSGVYYVRMVAEDRVDHQKIMLLK